MIQLGRCSHLINHHSDELFLAVDDPIWIFLPSISVKISQGLFMWTSHFNKAHYLIMNCSYITQLTIVTYITQLTMIINMYQHFRFLIWIRWSSSTVSNNLYNSITKKKVNKYAHLSFFLNPSRRQAPFWFCWLHILFGNFREWSIITSNVIIPATPATHPFPRFSTGKTNMAIRYANMVFICFYAFLMFVGIWGPLI